MNYEQLKLESEKYKDTMSNMERMIAYAKGEEVDRIPFTFSGSDTLAPLYGYTMEEYRNSFEVQCQMVKNLDKDFGVLGAGVSLGLKGIGEAVGTKLVYPKNDIEYVQEHILTTYDDLDNMEVVNPYTNHILKPMMDKIRKYKEYFGEDLPIGTGVAGPLSTAIAIRKADLVMKDMIKNKDQLHKLLDYSVKCSLAWVEAVNKEFGITGVGLADPASSTTLISKKQFKEFTTPHMIDLVKGIEKITGKTPGLHICGKTKDIWMELCNIGFKSFSVDNCEDLEELKLAVGDRMSISGNVAPVDVLKNGTIDDVIESVRQCLLKGSDNPMGYTLAAGCQVPISVPRENLEAYIFAAKKYGRGAQKGKLCKGLFD